MNFKLIVAHCNNFGIGINNKLPWHFSEDLKRFSKLTRGPNNNNAIIMGRNTWSSLPKDFLPKRDNLILSSQLNMDKQIDQDHILKTFKNLDSLKLFCKNKNYDEIWVIGGESIYKQFLNEDSISELHITEIKHDYICDTFLPLAKNLDKFTLVERVEQINADINISYKTYKHINWKNMYYL
jgi:dihydrofolate reductase